MKIFVERDFLECFRENCDENNNNHLVFLDFGRKFTDIEWYFDFSNSTFQEFSLFKEEYPYFIDLNNYLDNQSIEVFAKNKTEEPSFIFTKEENPCFLDAEQKGFFCISWNNYDKKIESLLNINDYFDLSQEDKFSWKWFNKFNHIPCTKIIVNDNYILTDTKEQKIEDNIIPFLNRLIGRWENVEVEIFTKTEIMSNSFDTKKNEYQTLKHISYTIINNGKKFHDRYVYSNYFYISCGKGFNLIPHKKEDNNSDIVVKSILDYYTYKKVKNHKRMLQKHFEFENGL